MGKELSEELPEKAVAIVEEGLQFRTPIYVTLGDLSPELLAPHADPGFVLAGQGELLFVGLWDAVAASSASLERMVKSHVRYLQGGLFQQMQIPGSVLAKLVSTVANFPRDELLEVHPTPEGMIGVRGPLINREGELHGMQTGGAAQADLSAGDSERSTNITGADDAAHGDPNSEDGDPAPLEDEPALSERILHALKHSPTDFRTVTSLAKELGVNKHSMASELDKLGDKVRRPLGQEARYPDWYRLTEAGPTRQEKRARLKAIVTFSTMDDDF